MFNRAIQMKVVKTSKLDDAGTETVLSEDYVKVVSETVETVAEYVVLGVSAYVLLDTLRQIAVKLTPTL